MEIQNTQLNPESITMEENQQVNVNWIILHINIVVSYVVFKIQKASFSSAYRQETNERHKPGESLETFLSQKCNFHPL